VERGPDHRGLRRLGGGALGVAVIGSVYASAYSSRLAGILPAGIPGQAAALARRSVGAAYAAAGTVTANGHPALGQALHLAYTNAFLRAVTVGCLVAGGVTAAGALLAAAFLPAHPAVPVLETAGDASPSWPTPTVAAPGPSRRSGGAAPEP
jgi:hypothetical protein